MQKLPSNVDSRHYYRFIFLRSEKWAGIRLVALARVGAKCKVCGKVDWSNDVHHVRYRKNLNFCWSDFRVLCRQCHKIAHLVLAHRKQMGAKDNHRIYWRNVQRSVKRIVEQGKILGIAAAIKRAETFFSELEFSRAAVKPL